MDCRYQRTTCQICQILHKSFTNFKKNNILWWQPALVEAMWSARCACAAALGRIRAAVCLRACMHAILLLGWRRSEATTVIGVGTGQMRKPSVRAVPPVSPSSFGQEIRLFTEAKTTGCCLAIL
jgi:hypothetical protein